MNYAYSHPERCEWASQSLRTDAYHEQELGRCHDVFDGFKAGRVAGKQKHDSCYCLLLLSLSPWCPSSPQQLCEYLQFSQLLLTTRKKINLCFWKKKKKFFLPMYMLMALKITVSISLGGWIIKLRSKHIQKVLSHK